MSQQQQVTGRNAMSGEASMKSDSKCIEYRANTSKERAASVMPREVGSGSSGMQGGSGWRVKQRGQGAEKRRLEKNQAVG